MILPTKNLPPERALLGVGARILQVLSRPQTVSSVWETISNDSSGTANPRTNYTWFVLALDLLYALGAIELEGGVLRRAAP